MLTRRQCYRIVAALEPLTAQQGQVGRWARLQTARYERLITLSQLLGVEDFEGFDPDALKHIADD